MTNILAVTGHRPGKLGGYGHDVSRRLIRLAGKYLRVIKPDTVITGMALGWDQACALASIKQQIPFIAALPFENQHAMWSNYQRHLYYHILTHAAEIVKVSEGGYSDFKYQKRNEWMADNCTEVLALWDGSPGGTANMIRYATGPGRWRKLYNAWEEWE